MNGGQSALVERLYSLSSSGLFLSTPIGVRFEPNSDADWRPFLTLIGVVFNSDFLGNYGSANPFEEDWSKYKSDQETLQENGFVIRRSGCFCKNEKNKAYQSAQREKESKSGYFFCIQFLDNLGCFSRPTPNFGYIFDWKTSSAL